LQARIRSGLAAGATGMPENGAREPCRTVFARRRHAVAERLPMHASAMAEE
jgi:hypothetical protein